MHDFFSELNIPKTVFQVKGASIIRAQKKRNFKGKNCMTNADDVTQYGDNKANLEEHSKTNEKGPKNCVFHPKIRFFWWGVS